VRHDALRRLIIAHVLILWERLPMAAEAFGEGWQPRSFGRAGKARPILLNFLRTH
jgi:hypothetical protein